MVRAGEVDPMHEELAEMYARDEPRRDLHAVVGEADVVRLAAQRGDEARGPASTTSACSAAVS